MHTSAPAPIPFRRPNGAISALPADAAARVVTAAGDISMLVDDQGVIRDLSVSSPELAAEVIADWIDRPWVETVTPESRPKVTEMLREAAADGAARWREVNHPAGDHETILIRYMAVRPGGVGETVVIGRDMRSTTALQQRLLQVQQSLERDYLRLRQAESRYRLLFQTAAEAVLIVEAGSGRVREANPAASRLLNLPETALGGRALQSLLDRTAVEPAARLLSAVHAGATAEPVRVKLGGGAECMLSASMFRQDRLSCFLVRLFPINAAEVEPDATKRLQTVLERMPDGFVVTDMDLRILTANAAFLDMVHLASLEQARDQSLERFLGRPQVDLKVILSQLREHAVLRNFPTLLRGELGDVEEVELSAVAVPEGVQPCFGFTLRAVARRPSPPVSGAAPRSVEQLTELIGRLPMKEIVRESTDLIERLCIEAALTLTSNNRASAADLLGLSRQSLYVKLHRYGLAAGEAGEA